ncbi:hypothetical protein [Peptostreptococcus equinus]|uniref:Uncharacterized protein n=1 Tax=Peptostreptococcus equinus TaxID=3003601 RepID=A0ABY7JQ01_9FIRM|nr:hypothetical protein [Peptostreptococcus sp. CBA3647]WAW15429.1 hypothetical protein O0R46_03005 [Peptostreptococcus sp. CBA3647]
MNREIDLAGALYYLFLIALEIIKEWVKKLALYMKNIFFGGSR